jgi:hypothetical protein
MTRILEESFFPTGVSLLERWMSMKSIKDNATGGQGRRPVHNGCKTQHHK